MFLHQASFRHAKHVQSVMRRPFSATIATSKALKKLRTPEQRRQLEKTISLQNVARLMNRKLTVQKYEKIVTCFSIAHHVALFLLTVDILNVSIALFHS